MPSAIKKTYKCQNRIFQHIARTTGPLMFSPLLWSDHTAGLRTIQTRYQVAGLLNCFCGVLSANNHSETNQVLCYMVTTNYDVFLLQAWSIVGSGWGVGG